MTSTVQAIEPAISSALSRSPRRPAVGATLTSSRPQEIAVLERALRLEHILWDLYCALGDPQAHPHNPPPAVRRAADHRQHIIALRTRLAILGRFVPRRPTLGHLRRMTLQLWRQVGRCGPLLLAIAEHEQALSELYQDTELTILGRASRQLWLRLRQDLAAERRAAPIAAQRALPRGRSLGQGIYKTSSKHWAYARL